MKNFKNTVMLSAVSSLAIAASTYGEFPAFDDLTAGDTYHTTEAFISDGIFVKFVPFQHWDNTWTDAGVATVSTALLSYGYENELKTENITALYDFAGSVGPQAEVSFLFGEYGGNNSGNINLGINGDMRNVYTFNSLNGVTIGGCLFTVLSGGNGNDNGEVLITGFIETLSIGGQELSVDVPYCAEAFEDLPLNTKYWLDDSFTTELIPVHTAKFFDSSGSAHFDGFIHVGSSNSACGVDQELKIDNINAVFLFDAVSPIEDFRFQFGELGGNINIGINGEFKNAENYVVLDGMTIGGVTIHVLYGGYGNDCGIIEFEGVINKFLIGGQEHYVDCFDWNWVQSTPGDADGNGLVNIEDLLTIIGTWDSNDPKADLNGDGVVNVNDLLIVIANWAP